MDVYIGFDSAWMDSPEAPGAICAIGIENGGVVLFHEPLLVSFDRALNFIRGVRSQNGATLVALDQPTLVPNLTGMRPVERVAARLVSWLGGGLRPREESLILGDFSTGYMVIPASRAVRDYLTVRAREKVVAMDGIVPR